MIITRISGGLGNQLFQYALGKALSVRTGQRLALDTHFYDLGIERERQFTLSHFHVDAAIANRTDFAQIGIPDPRRQDVFGVVSRKLFRALEKVKPLSSRRFIIEPSFRFYPEILQVRDSVYLSGVWQSEKYFASCAQELRKEFTLNAPLSQEAQLILKRIQDSQSVAIHVRRGDQLYPHAIAKYGVLTSGYYTEAQNYIAARVKTPHYVVFSDDIEWVKKNLPLGPDVTYVAGLDYEDLILMSACQHTITAKSSFSWWGAWLNNNPEKIVITPKEQFGTPDIDDRDLIPESWIRL